MKTQVIAVLATVMASGAWADLRSTVLANQQTTIQSLNGPRTAELAIRSVTLDDPGHKTVYGTLILVREAKTRLFWWDLFGCTSPLSLSFAQHSAEELSFASNNVELVALRLWANRLSARSSRRYVASIEDGEKLIQRDVRKQLTSSWPLNDQPPSPAYTDFDLEKLFGRSFLFVPSDSDARPVADVTISRIAWKRGSWIIDIQNKHGVIGRLEISSALKRRG